jgi:hypothetical protein
MVQAALQDSTSRGMAKIAQDAGETMRCETCGKDAPPGSKFCQECADKADKGETASSGGTPDEAKSSEKTSSLRLQKLASAVEQIAPNIGNLDWSKTKRAQAPLIVGSEPPASPGVGPGAGPNALPTTDKTPTTGTQSTETGEARTGKPPMTPPMGTGANPNSAPTALEENIDTVLPAYPADGVLKQGGVTALYRHVMMRKAAAEGDTGSISAPKTQTLSLPEDQPSQMERPPEVTSQERLIASNQAVIDATKREAKEVPKKRMGEVLNEPALSAATDKVLDVNLGTDVVDQAGAKIASARVLLRKIASQGCVCERGSLQKGSCDFCKIASRMGQRKGQMSKKSQVPGGSSGSAGGAGAAPQPVPGGPMSGSGM